MEIQSTQANVIIIGGGLAGLAAASYLGRAGLAVTLFERSVHVGGRAASQNHDGYIFNRGSHALYPGGALTEVLQELGVDYRYGTPKGICLLHQDQMYPFPSSVSSVLMNRLLSISDKAEFARLFSLLPRLDTRALAHSSVQEWLEQTIKRPLVHQLMTSIACILLYSTALDIISAEAFLVRLRASLKSPVHYVEGGWQTLVDGLRHVAEQAGVQIRTSKRVIAVEHLHGCVQGVQLDDGSMLPASTVLLATSPQEATKLVNGGNYPYLTELVSRFLPARIAGLDVALSRLPNERYPIVHDMDRPRFMSTQSLYTRLAPEGGAFITTFKQLDPRSPNDPVQDERELEELLDIAQPGWRDVLVKRVFLPRIDALGMLPIASAGGYAGRPGTTVPGIANLYLAGDWIGAGFLADASMGSARSAAQLILQQIAAARIPVLR